MARLAALRSLWRAQQNGFGLRTSLDAWKRSRSECGSGPAFIRRIASSLSAARPNHDTWVSPAPRSETCRVTVDLVQLEGSPPEPGAA